MARMLPIVAALLGAMWLAGPAAAQHTLTGELPRPGAASQPVVLVAGASGRT